MLLPALFASCTKSGALTGSTTSSGAFNGSISGSVSGGLSPDSGATVNLMLAGSSTPLATTTTGSTGGFTLSYTNPGGTNLLYLQVTGGNAGGGTNSNIQLITLLGSTSSPPNSIAINELTTAAFSSITYAFGLLKDTNGTVTVNAPSNAAAVNNVLAQWNNLMANNTLNTSNANLSTGTQNAISTVANALASCVQIPANCSKLFNNAQNSTGGASVAMLDSVMNMLSKSSDLTPIYNLAQPLSSGTGFLISASPSALSIPMPTSITTTTELSDPRGIALDASGNLWVANFGAGTVSKLSSSGSTLGVFTISGSPLGIAIDAGGNLWIANFGSSVIELNSSGTVLGTFGVGSSPEGVGIDPSGNVWVVNRSGGSITELSSSGSSLGTFSTTGSNPISVAIDSSSNVWVTNDGSTFVSRFTPSGALVSTYSIGSGSDGITIDSSGNFWVSDLSVSKVTELNSLGSKIGAFSLGSNPTGITNDASGNIWVGSTAGIKELSPSGNIIGTYATSSPRNLLVDTAGNVWTVNQTGSNGVTKISGVTVGPTFFPYQGPQYPYGNE